MATTLNDQPFVHDSGDAPDVVATRGNSVPVVTALIVAIIAAYNLALLLNGDYLHVLDHVLANNYHSTWASREYWRPFTSWIPHLDLTHLLWDVAYLSVVGVICEKLYGPWRVLEVFFLGTFVGSWLSAACDSRFLEVLGSSAGTHAVAAYFCVRESLDANNGRIFRVLTFGLLGYLVYLTVHGLMYGAMGWPLGFFANSGFDHLGGIGSAVVVAVWDATWQKRKNRLNRFV